MSPEQRLQEALERHNERSRKMQEAVASLHAKVKVLREMREATGQAIGFVEVPFEQAEALLDAVSTDMDCLTFDTPCSFCATAWGQAYDERCRAEDAEKAAERAAGRAAFLDGRLALYREALAGQALELMSHMAASTANIWRCRMCNGWWLQSEPTTRHSPTCLLSDQQGKINGLEDH